MPILKNNDYKKLKTSILFLILFRPNLNRPEINQQLLFRTNKNN